VSPELEPLREELADLVSAVRCYVEQHAAAGTLGFPRAPGPPPRAALDAGARPAVTEGSGALPPERRLQSNPVAAVAPNARRDDAIDARAASARPPEPVPVRPADAPERAVSAPGDTGRAERVGVTAVAPNEAERALVTVGALNTAERAVSAPGDTGRAEPAAAPVERERPARTDAGPRVSAESRARLAALESEVSGCTACRLHSTRKQTVFARGSGSSGLCFVGEGPGADEDAQGYPFVGAAGQLLDRMIEAMGLDRDEVYVCNIVKCRPPDNRKPLPDEMAACRPFLEAQLELLQPEVMVALGATAVQGLFGTTSGITRLRGNWRLYQGKIAVMPTFHPAYLLRTPSAKREVWEDLKAVLRHLGREAPGRSR
jgi:uracil-DNA glycosylase family 4